MHIYWIYQLLQVITTSDLIPVGEWRPLQCVCQHYMTTITLCVTETFKELLVQYSTVISV